MSIKIINGQRVETPDDGNWLHNSKSDYTRYFTKLVYLGKNAEPWPECTDEEKVQWEEEHKDPAPESEEPIEQEGGEG